MGVGGSLRQTISTVNEAEPRLLADFETALDELVRSLLIGPSTTVPVVEGKLQLGTWQSVLFVECDGPRERTVQVTVSGSM